MFLDKPSFARIKTLKTACNVVLYRESPFVSGSSTNRSGESAAKDAVDVEPLVIDRGPYFDKTVSRNVTAIVGKTAYLRCRVRNLSNKTVSAFQLLQVSTNVHCWYRLPLYG